MSELKPVTRNEAYWAAVADDSITPPKPQTTEECILAAMSGNYPVEEIKPQTREQGLMVKAAEKIGTPVVQNVMFGEVSGEFDMFAAITELVIPEGVTSSKIVATDDDGDYFIWNKNMPNLKRLTFPSTYKQISYVCGFPSSGNYFPEEVVLPEGWTKISESLLYDTIGIKKITIPSTVIEIPYKAFLHAYSVETIVINKPKNSIEGAPWSAPNAEIIWNG